MKMSEIKHFVKIIKINIRKSLKYKGFFTLNIAIKFHFYPTIERSVLIMPKSKDCLQDKGFFTICSYKISSRIVRTMLKKRNR